MIDLHHGDCLDIMPTLEADSVDTIICDPPYGLEFMGKEWDKFGATNEVVSEGADKSHPFRDGTKRIRYGNGPKASYSFQQFMTGVFTEALRVAKPGAMLLAFGGTRTFHRLACAIEDAGWELRDTISWLYGSGFPKSHNIGKALNGNGADWHGWGTALKPAWEPVIVAMKPLDGTFAQNALQHGVAGLWIDGARVPITDGATMARNNKPGENGWKNSSGGPNSAALNGEPEGRWPANLIHDGSDEVLAGFPVTTSGKGGQPQTDKRTGNSGLNGLSSNGVKIGHNDTGSAARFFYCAKASRSERNAGLEGMEVVEAKRTQSGGDDTRGRPTPRNQNTHPTVKPIALMRYLARLTKTPTGGVVLDPFMGSGSTGIGAVMEGRDFIGIEQDAEYIEIARRRIEHWQAEAEREAAQLELQFD